MPDPVEPEGTIFDHIFDFFRSVSELGATWGEPWGVLFPAMILGFVCLSIAWGVKYSTERLAKDLFKPLLFGSVILSGLYIVASFSQ